MSPLADEPRSTFDKDFDAWCVSQKHPVSITAMKDIPALKEMSKRFTKKNSCFYNASRVVNEVGGAVYVEGFLDFHGYPMKHAWNRIGEAYFDVTTERFFSDGDGEGVHEALLELDPPALDACREGTTKLNALARVYFAKNVYQGKDRDLLLKHVDWLNAFED